MYTLCKILLTATTLVALGNADSCFTCQDGVVTDKHYCPSDGSCHDSAETACEAEKVTSLAECWSKYSKDSEC